MKNKTTVVCIKDGKVKVLTNPLELDYIHLSQYLINPKLDKVRGLSPHLWTIENGEVLPSVPHEPHPYDPEPEVKLEYRTKEIIKDIVKEVPKQHSHKLLILGVVILNIGLYLLLHGILK